MKKKRYPIEWTNIAASAKDRADWKCEACGIGHLSEERGAILTVHHLNEDTMDSRVENLVALCQRCHLRAEQWSRGGEYLDRAEAIRRLARIHTEETAQRGLFG